MTKLNRVWRKALAQASAASSQPTRFVAACVLLAASLFTAESWAQTATAGTEAAVAAAEPAAISPADIPARADADEKRVQAILARSQVGEQTKGFEQMLAEQATGLARLSELTESSDMTLLSVRRQESLERHWRLNERAIGQTRAELARATNVSSEDAAELARLRAIWEATFADTTLAPALKARAAELVDKIDRAQTALVVPLATMLDLGRKSNALASQVQSGLAKVVSMVEEQDRRLLSMDTPPLWSAGRMPEPLEPVTFGLRRNLQIEAAFAKDYDATHARLVPALIAAAALLLPLMFWLKRRARHLVASGQAGEDAMQALSRPWAAWLLLVAVGAVVYDIQGPIIRQQAVMLLAWIPLLGLLQRRILSTVGPWAYLSAVFYFLNVVASLLVGDQLLYRFILLAINLLMLLTLVWRIRHAQRSDADADDAVRGRAWRVVRWIAGGVLLVSAGANVLGNISLAAMLTSAMLDSSYVALAMVAGSKVVLALFQVLFVGPAVARFAKRHSASLVPAALNLWRTLMAGAWLIFTLQSFRVYGLLSTALVSVLTYEFSLGELSLSLGGIVAFSAATWAAFWLAKTIRLVLAEDILPGLPLPLGVGNSISSLSYYTILMFGLLAALAAAGFHVGQLAIIFGALGVGIGFGLQDVVKNFVSGMILMFERPIRRGDTVEVAGMVGQVREIGLRATIVTTFEGADVVVPNGMLLADKLVNWTLSGTRRRIHLDLTTAHSADPRRTIELLISLAAKVDGVSALPAPVALMTGLAPGALEFNLRVWTTDHADWVAVRSSLALTVRDGLAEAGIEVPMPQRVLHLRGASEASTDEFAGLKTVPK